MSTVIENLRYTAAHQWAAVESNNIAAVGITDFAQEALGDVVFVEFPKIGQVVTKDQACAVVESVKSASDVYAPVSGTIVEINTAIQESLQSVNSEPYKAWLFKIKLTEPEQLETLLSALSYQALTDQESN